MPGRVYVSTTRELSTWVDGKRLVAKVDDDSTVKLNLIGTAIAASGGSPRVETHWMDRHDLIAVRRLINRALRFIDE